MEVANEIVVTIKISDAILEEVKPFNKDGSIKHITSKEPFAISTIPEIELTSKLKRHQHPKEVVNHIFPTIYKINEENEQKENQVVFTVRANIVVSSNDKVDYP